MWKDSYVKLSVKRFTKKGGMSGLGEDDGDTLGVLYQDVKPLRS